MLAFFRTMKVLDVTNKLQHKMIFQVNKWIMQKKKDYVFKIITSYFFYIQIYIVQRYCSPISQSFFYLFIHSIHSIIRSFIHYSTQIIQFIFQVFSDCDLITGPPFVTVLPQQTASVPFNILTRKRGITDCVVCFVYDESFINEMGLNRY